MLKECLILSWWGGGVRDCVPDPGTACGALGGSLIIHCLLLHLPPPPNPLFLFSFSLPPLFLWLVIGVFRQRVYGMGGHTLYFSRLMHSFINSKPFLQRPCAGPCFIRVPMKQVSPPYFADQEILYHPRWVQMTPQPLCPASLQTRLCAHC